MVRVVRGSPSVNLGGWIASPVALHEAAHRNPVNPANPVCYPALPQKDNGPLGPNPTIVCAISASWRDGEARSIRASGKQGISLNIVFDLGGVLLSWDSEALIAKVFAEPESRAKARIGILGHPDWCELDRGTLPLQDAIARAAARTGLAQSAVACLMHQVPLSLVPLPEMADLLYRLKAGGHALFYLSNMHVASIAHLKRACTFWDAFAGGVISCHVHLVKPEPAIYAHLLEAYNLDAAETVFIDDMAVNRATAARLGIRTIPFEHPAQCEEQLRALGAI